MTEAATRRCSAKKVIFFPGLQYCGHWLICSERKGYYHRRPVFLPSHFARDRMKFILLVILVFWCKAEIQNRRTSQNIQLLNRTPQFTKSLSITACQFVKDQEERHHFPRKHANATKEHHSILGNT